MSESPAQNYFSNAIVIYLLHSKLIDKTKH